jgi:hypothetical protein
MSFIQFLFFNKNVLYQNQVIIEGRSELKAAKREKKTRLVYDNYQIIKNSLDYFKIIT